MVVEDRPPESAEREVHDSGARLDAPRPCQGALGRPLKNSLRQQIEQASVSGRQHGLRVSLETHPCDGDVATDGDTDVDEGGLVRIRDTSGSQCWAMSPRNAFRTRPVDKIVIREVLVEQHSPPSPEGHAIVGERPRSTSGRRNIARFRRRSPPVGAALWTAARREAYANDQGVPNTLVAVSGISNRSKADKDPAAWLTVPADQCAYATDWAAGKLRWQLTQDTAEPDALDRLAKSCPTSAVT